MAERSCFYAIDPMRPTAPGRPCYQSNKALQEFGLLPGDPAVAVGTGVVGFLLANQYDYPPGQLTVVLFCLVLVVAWILR